MPGCKQRPESLLITKTLLPGRSLYNCVCTWPLLLQVQNSLQGTGCWALCCPPPTLRIHILWKYWEIFHQKWICFHGILFFLCFSPFVITKDIPKKQLFFFSPKQSYSSTVICFRLPSCCLMTSCWVSGVFFSEAIMMYRESYVANQLNYKQKGWPQYDFKMSRTLIFYYSFPEVFSSLLAVATKAKSAGWRFQPAENRVCTENFQEGHLHWWLTLGN